MRPVGASMSVCVRVRENVVMSMLVCVCVCLFVPLTTPHNDIRCLQFHRANLKGCVSVSLGKRVNVRANDTMTAIARETIRLLQAKLQM